MEIFIVSGPVIIEEGKVLLDKHGDDNFWKFPGGKVKDFQETLEETCRREVKEELGIEVEIIKPLKPMMVQVEGEKTAVLIHYLARRRGEVWPADFVREVGWLPIENLPQDVAPNVKPVVALLEEGQ